MPYQDDPNPETFQIQSIVPVTSQQLSDMLITAVEGGSTYWCELLEISQDRSYQDPTLFKSPEVTLSVTPEDDESITKTIAQIIQASAIMSTIDMENFDAEDADRWFQTVMLGEIVYG